MATDKKAEKMASGGKAERQKLYRIRKSDEKEALRRLIAELEAENEALCERVEGLLRGGGGVINVEEDEGMEKLNQAEERFQDALARQRELQAERDEAIRERDEAMRARDELEEELDELMSDVGKK